MKELNVEALAQHLAYDMCFDAEMVGYEVSADNPEDVAIYLDMGRERARRYVEILEGT